MKQALLPCLIAAVLPAAAQTSPVELDPVVISAERSRQTTFDAPAAITAVTRDVIDQGGLQVNLSEALNRVPGITVLNRQNYAQDLQLSIRGFGARSTFGIRGVRLIVDGIPATMPDGQGQASNIALGSAQRIEVLRGPLAQLYGNAAGGVVQVFTGTDVTVPTLTANAATGPYGQVRLGSRYESNRANDMVVLDVSHYRTDGWREHSEARRDQINAKWERTVGGDTRISVVANVLDQPLALDPGGLASPDWRNDPRTATPGVKTQDARKVVGQQQIGGVVEQRIGARTTLTARLYFGNRDLDNALSTPLSAQQAITSSGGIVSFSRGYWGFGAQLAHELPLEDGRGLRLTGGVELDRMTEDRKGYINNAGVQGALKRDEHNTVEDNDAYLQAAYDLARTLTATAGVRVSKVKFRSEDHFIVPPPTPGGTGNPDDSGGVDYSATNPVLGLTWRALPTLNLYANAGRGFETPTFTELAYRPGGLTGLNTDLRASRSRHAEVGAKWKIAEGHRVDAALYDIRTRDEIVVDTNVGGRSTFRNVGHTTRRGVELQYLGRLSEAWRATLSATALRARFDEDAENGAIAGKRLPGTPERSAFAELAWTPKAAWGGFNAGVEIVHTGKLYVNDTNSAPEPFAPAATVLNLRAGFAQQLGAWKLRQLVRVDNATDKAYAGSVIVNESNQRYFEPALPRNWLLSLTAQVELR